MLSFFKKHNEIFLLVFAFVSFISMPAGNVAMALALLLFLFLCYKQRPTYNDNLKYYFKLLAIFVGAMLLTSLQSPNLIRSIYSWLNIWFWRATLFAMVVIGLQYNKTGAFELNNEELGNKVQRVLTVVLLGFTVNNLHVIYTGMTTVHRGSGFYGSVMMPAGFFCIILPVLLIALFQKNLLSINRWVVGTTFLVGCTALIVNATRGAWLALLIVCSLIALCYGWQNKKLGCIILAIVLCVGMGLASNQKIAARFMSSGDLSQHSERLLIWNSAWKMFCDYPLAGVGQGEYKRQYQTKYISAAAKEPYLTHAHNNLLQMLAEHGIIGFTGYAILVLGILGKSIKSFIKNGNPWHLAIIGSTLAIQIQGLTEYNFGQAGVMKCYWLVLGCEVLMAQIWDYHRSNRR